MTDRSIFTGVSGPGTDGGDPGSPIQLGHFFQLSGTGWVKAIRYWRANTNINGVQKGRVWQASGQSIVSGTVIDFPAPSGTGWQVATLPSPVQLAAGTLYKVTVHFTDNYSATGGYWASGAGVGGRTDGILTAPDAGGTPLGIGSVKQGSFAVTSNPDTYPDSYFNGGNYWVDLVVSDTAPSTPIVIDHGLPVETDSALPVSLVKAVTPGLPTEVDAGLPLGMVKHIDHGLAADVSTALPVTLAKSVLSGLPVETASALPQVLVKALQHGLPVEADAALAVVLGKALRLGLPVEVDSALPMQGSDIWPPTASPPVHRRWATSGPPVEHRWASTGPPEETAG